MNRTFVVGGIRFVANAAKMKSNPRMHGGVTFEQAAEVFFDPFLKVLDASRFDETRDAVLGRDLASRVLYVVHIVLEDDTVRLISARKATAAERNFYENG